MASALELLLQVEQEFKELQREYTMFLSDVSMVEPYQLRERMMNKVKRLRNMSNLRTEEAFRVSNMVSKVASHTVLWDRQVERKYTGDPKLIAKKKAAQAKDKQKSAAAKKADRQSVMITDAASQREQVTALYDEYMRLNLLTGSRKVINFSKFQNFIANQTDKIKAAKNVNKVKYEVVVQDEKVVIKSKSVREVKKPK